MTNNALLIYNQLRANGLSEAGALGLMGNWMAESGLEPGRLQGDFTQGRTYSRAYTDDVASGRIGRSQFGRDQKGYGLAQWTYYTRKEDLYDFWNGSGKALDDAGMQVSFAVQELSENGEYAGLWNVLKTTDDIWTAADKVCRLYERPYYNNVEARYQYALQLKAELDKVGDIFPAANIPEEPSGAGLSGRGEAAEGASFPDTSGKRDDPELASTTWPPRTICSGMNGDDTAVLQAVLRARGFPVHDVDGTFGSYLEGIVKDFQKTAFPDQPAEWDGIVGPKTWAKLLER